MLKTLSLATLFLLVVGCEHLEKQGTTSNVVDERTGKFQLVPVDVETGGNRLRTVLKIDTETGETWRLVAEEQLKWEPVGHLALDESLDKALDKAFPRSDVNPYVKPGGALEKLLKEQREQK